MYYCGLFVSMFCSRKLSFSFVEAAFVAVPTFDLVNNIYSVVGSEFFFKFFGRLQYLVVWQLAIISDILLV